MFEAGKDSEFETVPISFRKVLPLQTDHFLDKFS